MPLLPVYVAKAGGFLFLVTGVPAGVSAVAAVNPVWNYGPYRPDQVSTGAQPDWYMGFAEGLIRVMPGREVDVAGHTPVLGVLIPLLAFPTVLVLIGVYPFVEAWVTGDAREHHLLDRPRNRPVRTGLGVAWLSLYFCLLAGGGNDIFATRFHLSINTVTWAIRVAVFVVPVVAFAVAKRICLGLQRRDRDMLLHGAETGLIRRLPHGGYVQVHRPLDAARRHVLGSHKQYRPLDPGPAEDADGLPRERTRCERLRLRLSHALYGPASQVAGPTEEEMRHGIGR